MLQADGEARAAYGRVATHRLPRGDPRPPPGWQRDAAGRLLLVQPASIRLGGRLRARLSLRSRDADALRPPEVPRERIPRLENDDLRLAPLAVVMEHHPPLAFGAEPFLRPGWECPLELHFVPFGI